METDDNTPGASAEDESGLAAGLAGLSRLVAGRGTLEELLGDIAAFGMLAVPGADGAGVTMISESGPDTIVASATFVRDVDEIQYRLGEGPCISASATASTTGSGALGQDESWPEFGPLAAAIGVNSAISLPFVLAGEVLGTLNVYAHRRQAFDENSRRIGELFTGPAAVAIHNARALDQAQRATVRLQAALTSRSTIDQAIGIVMSRAGVTADEAFVRLRIMSQHEHVKLSAVAASLVDESVRRARAARPQDN